MSRKFQQAAAIAAVMMVLPLAGAATSGAFAQDKTETAETVNQPLEGTAEDSPVRFVSQEVAQPLPGTPKSAASDDRASLSDLVDSIQTEGEMSSDMRCLASAIYFEARGEPLAGQLAVGRVIVNRAGSGKFPGSYCGVVYQPSQFSFVRRGRMPAINKGSDAWHDAVATARIAHEGLWDSPARDALYFHASYVKPAWHRTQVARVDRHIFYK
ncbi:MAG: cell wall hydrolase [Candidatus Andeanibacterium colombiense]|uniref:Cell wall hydrolase n=1 Tax=Candidatus Andeanibacterium colombiense TaxID=3121345 RepID=A0AAJ5X0Q7_9SPHN|nr:MAG: cell wall hydrolase [Sphingomonadaceae bacterium]